MAPASEIVSASFAGDVGVNTPVCEPAAADAEEVDDVGPDIVDENDTNVTLELAIL